MYKFISSPTFFWKTPLDNETQLKSPLVKWIKLSEPLISEISGSESLIHFTNGDLSWVSLSNGVFQKNVGDEMNLYMNTDEFVYFDQNERLISNG